MPVVAPPVIVIHEAAVVGVQEHSDVVVTLAVPVPPSAVMVAEAGEMLKLQEIPDCVTENVANPPLTVIVPTRCEGEVLAWTEYPTVEGLAVPPPKLIVIQGTLLVADLAQLEGVPVIVNVPLEAEALAKAPVLLRVTEVQVWACRPKAKNSAANATRKVITDDKPRN